MKLQLIIKQIIDFLLSAIAIILLSPILLIIAIAIKIDSKGEIVFKQERLGKAGEPFNIYKFRTMVENAENIGDGLTVKNEQDNRITKVGYFLRQTSLDELPQLFNVLLGDMSLVGPRPPVTYFPYDGYRNYPDKYKKRFTFKPGITGLTQTTVRNSVSWPDRIEVDLKYINNFSLLFDLKILINTVVKVFEQDSIYS